MTSINKQGHVGLDLSPDVDRKFGGFMHEIWVELAHIEHDVPRLNEPKDRPAIGDVIHLAKGDSTVGHLRLIGAKKVLGMMDSLTTGPVSMDPTEHSALRQRYWREFYRRLAIRFGPSWGVVSADELSKVLAKRRAGQPVLLWSGGRWTEVLFQWWACDALSHCRVPPKDVWLATTSGDYARYSAGRPETPAHASDCRRQPKSDFV